MAKKIWLSMFVCISLLLLLTGCGIGAKEEPREKVDFTVVSEERRPEELAKLLEQKKTEEFHLTYTDGEALYICVGYGEQPTGGYSIRVQECSMAGINLYVDTLLVGPESVKDAENTPSYPMIVLKMEQRDVQVNFM
ncbi:MAG: protease complex subunit PrcB family protein [Lachnospiraceae bacterium]|nr:protease complex subunit PrcB family protein [Lachnospiraceae bacterium]